MKTSRSLFLHKTTFLGLACLSMFVASAAWAGLIQADLNPTGIATLTASASQNLSASKDLITSFGHTAGWPAADATLSAGIGKRGLGAIEPKFNGDRRAALPVAFVAPVTAMSAVFPIIGLIAAVAVTQLLRRRRIAQLRSSSPRGH